MWRVALALLLFVSASADALELTFEQAREMMLKNSRILKAYEQESFAAKYRYNQAVGGYAPSLTVSETYSKTDEPAKAAFMKMAQGQFTMGYFSGEMANPSKTKNYRTAAELVQPIFMQGQIYYGIKQAGEAKKAADLTTDRVKQMLLLDFYRSFYGYALAKEMLEAASSSFERTKKYFSLTKEFFENGLVVKSDLLVAETYMITSEQELKEAEKNLAVAESYLQRLVDTDEKITIICEKPNDKLEKALDEYISTAFANRHDLKAMAHYLNVSSYETRKAKGKFLPKVFLFAEYEKNGDSPYGDDGHGTTVGAQVSLNLFDGLKDFNKVKETKSKHFAMLHQVADKKLEIKTQVKEAYYGVIAAEKKQEVAKKRFEAAKSALEITENRFKEGLSKITELLDRENDQTKAQLAVCFSDYEFIVQTASLFNAVGILK